MSIRSNSALPKDCDVLLRSSNRLNMQPAGIARPLFAAQQLMQPRSKPRRHRHDRETGWSPHDRKKELPMITNALSVAQKLLLAGRKEVLAVGLMVLSTLGMIHPANAQEATYIIFDPPGSTSTRPTSINAE